MENSYTKYMELKEQGAYDFDPTKMSHVLKLARTSGLREQIMFTAMDILRDNPSLSNEAVIIMSAKRWHLI